LTEELTALADGGKAMSAEEKKNTEKFMALTLPPKHNAGQYMHHTFVRWFIATKIL